MIRILLALLLAASMSFAVVGCAEEDPTPGEALDNAIEQTEDTADEAADETEDAVEETGDAIEDMTD